MLLQCPEGAIPVGKDSFYTKSVDVSVKAFGSEKVWSSKFLFLSHVLCCHNAGVLGGVALGFET